MPFTGSYQDMLALLGNPQQGTYSNGVYIAPTQQGQQGSQASVAGATPYERLVRILANAEAGAITPEDAATQLQDLLAPLGEFTEEELPQVAAAWIQQAQREGTSGIMAALGSDQNWRTLLQIPPEVDYGAVTEGREGTMAPVVDLEPPVGGQRDGGSTTWPTPNLLPGVSESGREEQDVPTQYERWLLEEPTYQKASPFMREAARGNLSKLRDWYELSQAANPGAWVLNPETGEAQAPQNWLDYIKGGAPKVGRTTAMTGIRNILGALEGPEDETNPFGFAMRGAYGGDGTGANEAFQELLLSANAMGIPDYFRNAFMRGARNQFRERGITQPGGRVQDWARTWGLL